MVQRADNAATALSSAVTFPELGLDGWWLLALFLVFDVSMVGYLRSPRMGAWTHNAVHSYIGPAVLGVIAVVRPSSDAAFVLLIWAFTSVSIARWGTG